MRGRRQVVQQSRRLVGERRAQASEQVGAIYAGEQRSADPVIAHDVGVKGIVDSRGGSAT